jgi:Spy/CpxP family protein refolding chaperone
MTLRLPLAKPRRALATLLALAALLAPALLPAAADARGRGSPAEHVARNAERLGLDAETQAALAEIVAESEAEDRALHEQKRAEWKRMHGLLSAPELDRAAVLEQADAIDAIDAHSHRRRIEVMLRIHELLTPEQRQALVEIQQRERPWKRGRGPLGRCSADVRSLCADAPDGPAALRCLADRWDALSESCREGVARSRGGEPPPPPPDAP